MSVTSWLALHRHFENGASVGKARNLGVEDLVALDQLWVQLLVKCREAGEQLAEVRTALQALEGAAADAKQAKARLDQCETTLQDARRSKRNACDRDASAKRTLEAAEVADRETIRRQKQLSKEHSAASELLEREEGQLLAHRAEEEELRKLYEELELQKQRDDEDRENLLLQYDKTVDDARSSCCGRSVCPPSSWRCSR